MRYTVWVTDLMTGGEVRLGESDDSEAYIAFVETHPRFTDRRVVDRTAVLIESEKSSGAEGWLGLLKHPRDVCVELRSKDGRVRHYKLAGVRVSPNPDDDVIAADGRVTLRFEERDA